MVFDLVENLLFSLPFDKKTSSPLGSKDIFLADPIKTQKTPVSSPGKLGVFLNLKNLILPR